MTKEIDKRITLGWKKYWSLKEVMKNNDFSMSLKRRVFESCVLPSITYGCETWVLTKAHIQKLQVCQRAMERSMLGIKIKDKIRNTIIRERTEVIDIIDKICRQKWRWAEHMARD